MIDPNFWVDEKLGRVPREARFTFMGCISQSDDEGRLQGHPALLKSLIFPYDTDITHDDMKDWLHQLASEKLITMYEVDGQSYIQLPNFAKHQTINKKTYSKLPPPPTNDDYGSPTVVGDDGSSNGVSQEKGSKEKGSKEKGKEDPRDSVKDKIHELINQCKIEKYNLHSLDVLFSYIGTVDIEIIEAAIKKGEGKHINYVTNTLEGMYKEGITKKEQLYQKPNMKKQPRKDKVPDYIDKPPDESKPLQDEAKKKRIDTLLKDLGESG